MGLALTVLGCAAAYPRPGEPCSGYLVSTVDARVWVDCGTGTFAALQQHIDPASLDAVWVSHLHPDHVADLFAVFSWAVNTPDAPRLPVYGPPGWASRVAAALPSDDAHSLVHQTFAVHELADGCTTEVGDLRLRSVAVDHSVPAFGLRAEHDGRVIAYSGDTGPCDALLTLADNADLLVCEAGATRRQPGHCTPTEAGMVAAMAHAGRLVLTHLPVHADGETALQQAADAGATTACLAQPGTQFSW
ncbi:MAG: MBL fold metallo-hydrolase [Actinobacteria bacterium]|nr:MBL fold metallo-hydrolase [Actinomycetota bacterium]MBI3688329.1 MBL fold metallo-hydrolase [Actinomycetota bacterium]